LFTVNILNSFHSYLIFNRPLTNRFQINFTSLNKLVFIYLSLRLLTDGVEEFLILPTAWYYIKDLGETNTFLGLTLAAYSAGTLVFAPFIGLLAVKCQASKALVVMCGLVKLFGNVLYSIPVNGYFPLFGRFISGIGEGTTGVLYGAVTKCTTNKNRAKAFLYFEGLFCIGEVCGPAIGSLLIFNFNILGEYIGN
jgi:MFS family permease